MRYITCSKEISFYLLNTYGFLVSYYLLFIVLKQYYSKSLAVWPDEMPCFDQSLKDL